jgi:hypothetical protein
MNGKATGHVKLFLERLLSVCVLGVFINIAVKLGASYSQDLLNSRLQACVLVLKFWNQVKFRKNNHLVSAYNILSTTGYHCEYEV